MKKETSIAVIAGLAIGAFIGYEATSWGLVLGNYWPYSALGTLISNHASSS